MRKFVTGLLALLLLAFVSSCSLDEKIAFNEDFSGHYEMTMDMSFMIDFMSQIVAEMESSFKEMDEEGATEEKVEIDEKESDEPDQAELMTAGFMAGITAGFKEASHEIDSIETAMGIENMAFVFDSVNQKINVAFDFPDLKSLGNFYQSFRENMAEDQMSLDADKASPTKKNDIEWIVLKGNTITFKGDKEADKSAESNDDVDDFGGGEMFKGMNEAITVASEYVFPRKVKSTNHPFAEIDGNKVSISYTLEEMDAQNLAAKDIIIEFEK